MTLPTGRGEAKGKGQGFTLVEVLVAVVILSTAAVLILQSLATVSHALNVVENRSNVYAFAVSKMAELEMAAREGEGLPEEDRGSFRIGLQAFKWQVSASPVTTDPPLELKSVTLRVIWHQGSQRHGSKFSTLLKIPQEEEEE